MRALNILFNHKTSSGPQKIAGVENVFLYYSELLIKDGFEVISITKPNISYKQNLLDMGSIVCEINAMGHGDIITMARLGLIILKFKPDIIICHSGRALFMVRPAAKIFGVPVVAVDHGVKVKKFLKADYVFSVNSHSSNEMIKSGKDKARSLIVPNMVVVPDDFIEPQNKKFHNPVRVGSLGRIGSDKNHLEIIKALAILKSKGIKIEFIIAGEGSNKNCVIDLAKELEVENQIKFVGWVSDKKTFFNEIDIFILPSTIETFGIVLLEAMLYKAPIISGDSFGPTDILENEIDALIVDSKNIDQLPSAIASAVERLMNDPDFAINLAENAYKKFHQKYSSMVVVKQIKNLLYKIIGKGNLRR